MRLLKTGAIEYGEGVMPHQVVTHPRGLTMMGCCYACDLGYEGDDCTCGADRLVVWLYNGALPR